MQKTFGAKYRKMYKSPIQIHVIGISIVCLWALEFHYVDAIVFV